MGISSAQSLFDVGCGCGAWLSTFKSIYQVQVGGVDISQSSIDWARSRHEDTGIFTKILPKVSDNRIYRGDMRSLTGDLKQLYHYMISIGSLQYLMTPNDVCVVGLSMYDKLKHGEIFSSSFSS